MMQMQSHARRGAPLAQGRVNCPILIWKVTRSKQDKIDGICIGSNPNQH